LAAAIREYVQVADKNPDSRGLVERLRDIETEIEKAPDPQQQGAGVIHNPGAGGRGEATSPDTGGQPQVQINIGGDGFRAAHAQQALRRAHRR